MASAFLGSSSFIVSNLWVKRITIVKSHLCPHYAYDLQLIGAQAISVESTTTSLNHI